MDWELIWWCVAFFLGIAFVIYAAMRPTRLQVSEETIARIEKNSREW